MYYESIWLLQKYLSLNILHVASTFISIWNIFYLWKVLKQQYRYPFYFSFELIVFRSNSLFSPLISNVHIPESCLFHFFLVPLQPGQITASNIKNSSLILDWTLTDTSPGNTTYTIYTYESINATGTNFLMNKSSKVYGRYQLLVCISIELLFFSKDVSVLLDLFATTIAVMRLHLIITR